MIYYVANSGLDSNVGTSPASPWRTISHVNAQSFLPGDLILFNQGDVWREQLVIPSNGSNGFSITFGFYGIGAAPQILGSVPANLPVLWTNESVNIWFTPIATQPRIIWRNGLRMILVPAKVNLLADNQAFWDSVNKRVYVFSPANPANSFNFEIPQQNYGILGTDKHDISVNGLQVSYHNLDNIHLGQTAGPSVNWTISNCNLNGCLHYNIGAVPSGPAQAGQYDGLTIFGNQFSDFGGDAGQDRRSIQLLGADAVKIYNNTCVISDLPDNGYGGFARYSFSSSANSGSFIRNNSVVGTMSSSGGTHAPIAMEHTSFVDVAFNTTNVNMSVCGVWCDEATSVGDGCDHITIHHNHFVGVGSNPDRGIMLENSPLNSVYYNTVDLQNCPNANRAIWIRSDTGGNSNNCSVQNNACIIPANALAISIGTGSSIDHVPTRNATVQNNVMYATGPGAGLLFFGNSTNDSSTNGHVINYNCYFGSGLAYTVNWYGTFYSTMAAFHSGQGFETNGVSANPQFIDSVNGNFALLPNSPLIDKGANLGLNLSLGLDPISIWPNNIVLADQNASGSGWEIGAYIFTVAPPVIPPPIIPPIVPTIPPSIGGQPRVLSDIGIRIVTPQGLVFYNPAVMQSPLTVNSSVSRAIGPYPGINIMVGDIWIINPA